MSKNKRNHIENLILFNEKVDKLINTGFTKYIQQNRPHISIKISTDKKSTISHTFLNQDSIDAFILTIRFFIQNNESSSLKNMTELYGKIYVSQSIKDDFNLIINKVNSELDKATQIEWNHKNITRREIFDTFIYGVLAHANRDKKIKFDAWMQNPIIKSLVYVEFYKILIYLLNCLAYIKNLNIKAIEELKTSRKNKLN